MKRYKAIFFDWDGTAVLSRSASVVKIVAAMKPLLSNGVKLCVVSGTTYENIANGKLIDFFTSQEQQNLYFGLARGAQNWGVEDNGSLSFLGGVQPDVEMMEKVHQVSFNIHRMLFLKYGFNTDIIFNRPNYCKIDLLSGVDRGECLFYQEGETRQLLEMLHKNGFVGGLSELISLAKKIGEESGIEVKPTTDAKYLEVGLSTKSDNVNFLMDYLELSAKECCFWGDEFLEIDSGVFGSDSYMITNKTKLGDFYDVSEADGKRPHNVVKLGGGVDRFISFLEKQV